MRVALWGLFHRNEFVQILADALKACGSDVWHVAAPMADGDLIGPSGVPTVQADDTAEFNFDVHIAFDEGTLAAAKRLARKGRFLLCTLDADGSPMRFLFRGKNAYSAVVPIIPDALSRWDHIVEPQYYLSIDLTRFDALAYSCAVQALPLINSVKVQTFVLTMDPNRFPEFEYVKAVRSGGSHYRRKSLVWCLNPTPNYGVDVLQAMGHGCVPVVFDNVAPGICVDLENCILVRTPINTMEFALKLRGAEVDFEKMLDGVRATAAEHSLDAFRSGMESLLDEPEVEVEAVDEVGGSRVEVIGNAAAAVAAVPAVRKLKLVNPNTPVLLTTTDGSAVPFLASLGVYDDVRLIDSLDMSRLDRDLNVPGTERVMLDLSSAYNAAKASGRPISWHLAQRFPIGSLYDTEIRPMGDRGSGDRIIAVGPSVSHLGTPFRGDVGPFVERIRREASVVVTDDPSAALLGLAVGVPVVMYGQAPSSVFSAKKSRIRCSTDLGQVARAVRELGGSK